MYFFNQFFVLVALEEKEVGCSGSDFGSRHHKNHHIAANL
jgi:hypothetical protein